MAGGDGERRSCGRGHRRHRRHRRYRRYRPTAATAAADFDALFWPLFLSAYRAAHRILGDRHAAAFVRGGELFEQRTDGTGLRRLAAGSASAPTWSPTGRDLAFAEPVGHGARRIGALDVATGKRRTLEEAPEFSFDDPAWSPDGRRVAMTRRPIVQSGAPGEAPAVWVVDLATGDGTKVADGARPSWSPDGTVVFDCPTGLCTARIRSGGGSAVKAVPHSEGLTDAAWSPDRRWLAALDASFGIVVLAPDGSGRRPTGADAWRPA